MKEPIGDTIFFIFSGIFCFTIAFGWVYLLIVHLLIMLFPIANYKLEAHLKKAGDWLGKIQTYSIYGAIVLILLRLAATWLGWAPPLFGSKV